MQITELQTTFYSGFSLQIDKLRFAFVYMNALKSIDSYDVEEGKEIRHMLRQLFMEHALVTGDLNSTPFAIEKELGLYGVKRWLYTKPTYLFPGHELRVSADIPCFDNAVWDPVQLQNLSYKTLVKLPKTTSRNPRNLIKDMGLVSDHVPIEIIIPETLSAVAFNVADPILWSQYYPNAGQGFELTFEAEKVRQTKIFDLVQDYVREYDVVFLQEVPSELAKRLKNKYSHAMMLSMQTSVAVQNPSQLVLITRK